MIKSSKHHHNIVENCGKARLLIGALIMAFSGAAYADNSLPVAHTLCATIGDIGNEVMLNRQLGVSMGTLLAPIANDDADKFTQNMRNIVVTAFDTPRYQTESMRRIAAEEHRNWAERECFKTLFQQQ